MNKHTITWEEIQDIVAYDQAPPFYTLGIDTGNGFKSWESLRRHERHNWRAISEDDFNRRAILVMDPEAPEGFDLADEARTILYGFSAYLTDDQWVLLASYAPDVQDPKDRLSLSHRIRSDSVAERRGITTTISRVREGYPWFGELIPALSVTVWDDESVDWSGPGAR